jgi:hypothetical protein
MNNLLCFTRSQLQVKLALLTHKTQKPQLSLRLYLWLSGRQDMNVLDNQLVTQLKFRLNDYLVMET